MTRELVFSERFNAPDADIVYRSSDGIHFRIRSSSVKATEGCLLPTPDEALSDQVLDLTEESSTLDLLFYSIHASIKLSCSPLEPTFDNLGYKELLKLENAARKYHIGVATKWCIHSMKVKGKQGHSLEVLEYFVNNHYGLKDINQVARYVTFADISKVSSSVPPEILHAWLQYYKQWLTQIHNAIRRLNYDEEDHTLEGCYAWFERAPSILVALCTINGIKSGRSMCSLIDAGPDENNCCTIEAQRWKRDFKSHFGEDPLFTDFLDHIQQDTPASSDVMVSPHCTSTISEQFRASDADIVYRSSDGVQFYIHSDNLKHTSGCLLPTTDFLPDGELVYLTETASTLELMFQFMYPQPQPKLDCIAFDTLAQLSEAVEKYQVYPAMQICNLLMRQALQDHPLEVLDYAARHGYPELSNEAALFVTLADVPKLPPPISSGVFHAWLRYYNQWCTQIRSAIIHSRHTRYTNYVESILQKLGTITRIKSRESICSLIREDAVVSDANKWRDDFNQKLGPSPCFTDFL